MGGMLYTVSYGILLEYGEGSHGPPVGRSRAGAAGSEGPGSPPPIGLHMAELNEKKGEKKTC
jgi:hypothetical protein